MAEKPEVASAVIELAAAVDGCGVRVTSAAGDARRFARQAAAGGVETVVVFGGDGTVNEVVSGLVGDGDVGFGGAVAVIPTGTANDFAKSAGIPGGSPSEAVAAIPGYRPVALDLGRVSGDAAGWFLNVASAGFGVEASSAASDELKAVLGRVSYLVAGVASAGEARPRAARIREPDGERRVTFHLLAIGNGRCAGGGMPLCPTADPTDGLFDVTIVPKDTVGATLAEIVRNGLDGIGEAGIRFRTPWIEVHGDERLQVNLDGEPASGSSFRFEVRPGALRVLLPPDSPMLTESRGDH